MKKMFQTIKRSGGTVLLLVAAALFTLGTSPVKANNIRILGKPQVIKDTAKQCADIFFDIAWDNSWYLAAPHNYDAAWIFVKCYNSTTSEWHHAYLDDTLGHYSIGSYNYTTMRPIGKNENIANEEDSVIYWPVASPRGSGYMVPHFGTKSDGKERVDAPMVLEPYHSWAKWQWGKLDGIFEADGITEVDPDAYHCVGFFLHRDTAALFNGFEPGENLQPGLEHDIKYYGAGDVVIPAIQFRWHYSKQGYTNSDDLGIKVFAVEMVYIPEGSFYLGGVGDQLRQPGAFTCSGTKFGSPFHVTSEDPIPVGENVAGGIWAVDSMQDGKYAIEPGTIGELFPKGYAAFYIMRYELTQQAWCEFLNCLKTVQQNTRVDGELTQMSTGEWTCGRYKPYNDDKRRITHLALARNWVKIVDQPEDFVFGCDANNNFIYDEMDTIYYNGWELNWGYYHRAKNPTGTSGYIGSLGMDRNLDGQDIAMNMVSFYDLMAYADFACLRPMTELEYEKACRGPKYPKPNEFAWGDCHYKYFCQPFNTPDASTIGSGTTVPPLNHEKFSNGNAAYCFGKTLNRGNEKVSGLYNCGLTKGMYYTASVTGGYEHVNVPAPLRVGCFADTSTTSRHHAGASYWGVMNMSDNVAEMCISAYWDRARSDVETAMGDYAVPTFRPFHGNGELTKEGESKCKYFSTGEQILTQRNDARMVYINRGAIFIPSKCDGGLYKDPTYSKTRNFVGAHDACRNSASDATLDGPNSGQRPNTSVGKFYPIEGGMVGSRARWNHDVNLDKRNYLDFGDIGNEDLPQEFSLRKNQGVPNYAKWCCMQGIRCVRTAADEHPQDAFVAPCGNNGTDWWR